MRMRIKNLKDQSKPSILSAMQFIFKSNLHRKLTVRRMRIYLLKAQVVIDEDKTKELMDELFTDSKTNSWIDIERDLELGTYCCVYSFID